MEMCRYDTELLLTLRHTSVQMKRTTCLLLGLCCAASASAQLKIETVKPRTTAPEKAVTPRYDSTANIRVTDDMGHYASLVGQRMLFYPRDIHADLKPVAYFNFLAETPAAVGIDTVWLRKPRKKIRPGDFRVDTVYSDVYSPHYFRNFGHDDITPLGCSFYEADGIGTLDYSGLVRSGWFTPAEAVEGRSFELLGAERRKIGDFELLLFRLRDAEGRTCCWFAHAGKDAKNLRDEYFPAVIEGEIEKYRSACLGKDFFLTGRKADAPGYVSEHFGMQATTMEGVAERLRFGTELHCEDVRLIGDASGYAVPSFVFKRASDSVRIYVPLTRYPVPFGVEGYTLARDRAFVDEMILTPAEEVYARRAEEERRREEARLALEKEQRERKAALTRKYGKSTAELILSGRVRIGMTQAMCREAWGVPDDINRTSGSWGVYEQWVYGSGSYLYFENGVLSSIQN